MNRIIQALSINFLNKFLLQPVFARGLIQIAQETEKKNTFLEASRINRKTIQALLDIKEFEALKLATNNKQILAVPKYLLIKNWNICIDKKISKKTILKYPFLLHEAHLDEKIATLERLPIDLPSSIPLAQLGTNKLLQFVLSWSNIFKKLNYLCKTFKVSFENACDISAKKSFLISKSTTEIEELLKIFYESGFTRQHVLNDLWIFKYSKEFIKNRLKFIKEHGIDELKTWMLRCPEETLYKHIKRESDNRDILGENSVAQYLSEKLDCSESVAKMLIRKHPQLQKKNLLKINVMIDLLNQQGFTALQICRVPKVLLHSTKTTDQRLKQLTNLGIKPDTLYILTKSQKQYTQHIGKLEKAKAKAEGVM